MSAYPLAGPRAQGAPVTRQAALALIASRAADLDAHPRLPSENLEVLLAAGVPQRAVHAREDALAEDIGVVRSLARADASTARIIDGHLNGAERLLCAKPSALISEELERIAAGELLIGVWGADPRGGEGPPARIVRGPGSTASLRGVKTFCSGAGGVQRALVVARDEEGSRRLAYVDASSNVLVDRGWYRASGLRSSESHRVEFHDTPVLAMIGGADELAREPLISRDSVRTAATWAGLADAVIDETRAVLGRSCEDQLRLYCAGAMRVARATIDRWLEHCARVLPRADAAEDQPGAARDLAAQCRIAIAQCAQRISRLAGQACGSHPLSTGGGLDRVRRDLDLFLLQHRLDPRIVQLGAGLLEREGADDDPV